MLLTLNINEKTIKIDKENECGVINSVIFFLKPLEMNRGFLCFSNVHGSFM